MLQVWRELWASKQDHTFDHVIAPMEVQKIFSSTSFFIG
jgi:hypothetical protein